MEREREREGMDECVLKTVLSSDNKIQRDGTSKWLLKCQVVVL